MLNVTILPFTDSIEKDYVICSIVLLMKIELARAERNVRSIALAKADDRINHRMAIALHLMMIASAGITLSAHRLYRQDYPVGELLTEAVRIIASRARITKPWRVTPRSSLPNVDLRAVSSRS